MARGAGRDPDAVAYHRTWWDVRSIGRCLHHGVELTDMCPRCRVPLTWRQTHVLRCPRGCELLSSQPTGNNLAALDRYLSGRLGIGPRLDVPVLDALSYCRAVALCERLGRLRAEGEAPGCRPSDPAARSAMREAGFGMALTFIPSVAAALGRTLAAFAGEGTGLMARYGWIYSGWLACATDEEADFVRPILRDHAVASGVIAPDEPALHYPGGVSVCLTAAARNASLSFKRCRRLLAEADVIPAGSRRGVAFALDPERVRSALGHTRLGASRSHVAHLLGVGRSRVGSLLATDLLERVGRRIDANSVYSLLGDLARISASSPPKGVRPIPFACQSVGMSIASACHAILDGRLRSWRPADEHLSNLAGISVLPSELRRLTGGRPGISVVDAARATGVHHECVALLARAGAILRISSKKLCRCSVDVFAAQYVTAAAIGRERGRSARSVIAECGRNGILPAFDRPKFRQVIYERRHA